jgi:hypothetical protein
VAQDLRSCHELRIIIVLIADPVVIRQRLGGVKAGYTIVHATVETLSHDSAVRDVKLSRAC